MGKQNDLHATPEADELTFDCVVEFLLSKPRMWPRLVISLVVDLRFRLTALMNLLVVTPFPWLMELEYIQLLGGTSSSHHPTHHQSRDICLLNAEAISHLRLLGVAINGMKPNNATV